jgi:hypothetical protein
MNPTGIPSFVKPQGIDTDGWPVKSEMPVFFQAFRR